MLNNGGNEAEYKPAQKPPEPEPATQLSESPFIHLHEARPGNWGVRSNLANAMEIIARLGEIQAQVALIELQRSGASAIEIQRAQQLLKQTGNPYIAAFSLILQNVDVKQNGPRVLGPTGTFLPRSENGTPQ